MILVTSCTTDPTPSDPGPSAFERAWSESIRPGDAIVAVPGTGGFSTLGVFIEQAIDPAHPDVPPDIDARTLLSSVEVLEAAIAAAQRAGISDAEIEAGAVDLAIWGAGITKLTAFRYRSLGGLHVTFDVIGGTSVCAVGGIFENLANYNAGNADVDASDLYRRTQTWLSLQPGTDRHVNLVSHSWGGIVAEYFATHLASYESAHGLLPDASVGFVIAGGVPGFLPGFRPLGPDFRTVESIGFDITTETLTYEVDRPDDPAHSFDPGASGGGHHYIIMDGDDYLGWYGITTDELSCAGVLGACPRR